MDIRFFVLKKKSVSKLGKIGSLGPWAWALAWALALALALAPALALALGGPGGALGVLGGPWGPPWAPRALALALGLGPSFLGGPILSLSVAYWLCFGRLAL